MARDWRDDRIADLERRLKDRDRIIEEQGLQIRKLLARVAKLEEQLAASSQNSSKPPSSDPPWILRPPKKPPSGRKPGGQPGHKGSRRALVPPERVDEVREVWPERCEHCEKGLDSGVRLEVGDAVLHQVVEVPPVRAHVTEYRMHTQCCPHCEWATLASLPDGVPTTTFGPRLQAVVSISTGVFRLSKRTAVAFLGSLFGVDLALGSVTACEQRTSEVLAAPVESARRYVEGQAVAYVDETGWREARNRAWVWVAVTSFVTIFLVHARRNTGAARQLLGRFAGILVTDRWSAYEDWPLSMRQLCWAHQLRYFTAFSECRGAAGLIGKKLLDLTHQMFRWWHRVRDGTLARSTFQANMRPVRIEIERLLDEGTRCGHSKVEGTCRAMLKLAPALWTFVRVEGVEPTNNTAERAIRPSVLMRKISFGTHSEDGSRFVERMLTVAATLKQQGRDVVEYVTEACERSIQGRPVPSLLPSKRVVAQALARAA